MAPGRRYTPRTDALPERYCALMAAAGFDGALLVQPSFLGTDNAYVRDIVATSRQSPTAPVLRGVAVLDPSVSQAELQALNDAGFVGVRLNCFAAGLPALNEPLWQVHLHRVAALGWHVELHVEGPRLTDLLDRLQGFDGYVVVDHFGLPTADDPTECSGFRRLLSATDPRVCVKLSAPWRVFPDLAVEAAARACGPLARRLFDAIGPDRLIWGSDWPWTQHEKGQSYAQCAAWAAEWYEGTGVRPGAVPDWLLNTAPV